MAFPYVPFSTSGSSNGTAHPITLPNCSADDYFLILFNQDGSVGPSVSGAITFTAFASGISTGNNSRLTSFYRVANGTESGTITINTPVTEISSWIVYTVRGADTSTAPQAVVGSGSSASPNPLQLNPSWGLDDNLWFAVVGRDAVGTAVTYPSNYTLYQGFVDPGSVGSGSHIAGAGRQLNASGENPGAYSFGETEQFVTMTIAFKPTEVADLSVYQLFPRKTSVTYV